MSKLNYPKIKDLEKLIEQTGFNIPEGFEHNTYLDAAIDFFESQTHWKPFLSNKKIEERSFKSSLLFGLRTEILELDVGLISLDSLRIKKARMDQVDALQQDIDFQLMPKLGYSGERPFEWIEFRRSITASDEIKIKGVWGRCLEVPEDVWLAILRKAASDVIGILSMNQRGGLVSWSEGDIRETYSTAPMDQVSNLWHKEFTESIQRYRRFRLGS